MVGRGASGHDSVAPWPCDLDHAQRLSSLDHAVVIHMTGSVPDYADAGQCPAGQARAHKDLEQLCQFLTCLSTACEGTPAYPWLTSDSFLCLWLSQFDDEDAALEYEEGGEVEDEGEEVPGDDEGEGGEFGRAHEG